MDKSDHRQAEILETCLSRLMAGGVPVDELARVYPGDADWLKPLLLSAWKARQAVELPAMPARARAEGERRLRAHIRSAAPRSAPSPVRRLRPAFALATVALVAVLLGSVSGIAYAAESSLPGDGLYPVKQVIEQVQLGLSLTPQDEAELLVRLSEERLREAEQLSAGGRTRDLPAALEGYNRAMQRLLGLAGQMPAQDGGESLQAIADQLGHQAEVLTRIQASAPQAAQPGLERAMQQSSRNRATVEEMLKVHSRETGLPADHGKKPTPAASETPGPGQGKDKDPGKGQGRGRPSEIPSG